MKKCQVLHCDGKHEAKGFCKMHYQRMKKGQSLSDPPYMPKTLEQKFWEKVEVCDGCWRWHAAKLPSGYGIIGGSKGASKNHYAHRVSYEIHHGPIPDGMVVMHTCDNPECCNPSHLRTGTYKQNSEDMVSKGRASKGPGFVGELHPRSKLSASCVRAIRKSEEPSSVLAKKFAVSRSCVGSIRSGKNWSHVK